MSLLLAVLGFEPGDRLEPSTVFRPEMFETLGQSRLLALRR